MAAVSRPLNGRMAEPGPITASAHKDDRKALAKIAAGQGVGTVQSRGSMRLAAHRLGARALRAPGGRVAALEWSQMASARRAAGRPGVRGRGPQRPCEVCQDVLWCTFLSHFLCMECAWGRCGRGWRGERPSRDLLERASHRAAAKRACCERRHVSTQELLAALSSCTRSACRAHADTCTCVTVRDRGAREHGRLRAPRPGVLDLEAARSYLPILSASNLCTQLYVLHAANSA